MVRDLGVGERRAHDRRGRRGLQPDHLVRLGGLGPGRQLRDACSCCSPCASCGRRAASGRRSSRSSAALMKPQLAILIPIVAAVTIRRALWPDGGYGVEGGARAVRVPAGSGGASGPIRILSTAWRASLTAVVAVGAVRAVGRLVLDDGAVRRLVADAARVQHRRDLLVRHGQRVQPVGAVPGRRAEHGDQPRLDLRRAGSPTPTSWAPIGPFPAAAVGGALLALLLFVVVPGPRRPTPGPAHDPRRRVACSRSRSSPSRRASTSATCSRCSRSRRSRSPSRGAGGPSYVVASIATFLNMYAVLTTIYPDNPSISDWLGIGDAHRVAGGRHADRAAQHRGLPVGLAQLRAARPADARRGARTRARARHLGRRHRRSSPSRPA